MFLAPCLRGRGAHRFESDRALMIIPLKGYAAISALNIGSHIDNIDYVCAAYLPFFSFDTLLNIAAELLSLFHFRLPLSKRRHAIYGRHQLRR